MTTSPDGGQTPARAQDEHPIPAGVRHLAGELLHNVSELEVALLARRSPLHVWNASTVSRTLKIGHGQAEQTLDRLVAIGLLESLAPAGYRYRSTSADTSEALDALSRLYRSHRQAVLRLLFTRSKGAVSYFPPEAKRSRP